MRYWVVARTYTPEHSGDLQGFSAECDAMMFEGWSAQGGLQVAVQGLSITVMQAFIRPEQPRQPACDVAAAGDYTKQ